MQAAGLVVYGYTNLAVDVEMVKKGVEEMLRRRADVQQVVGVYADVLDQAAGRMERDGKGFWSDVHVSEVQDGHDSVTHEATEDGLPPKAEEDDLIDFDMFDESDLL